MSKLIEDHPVFSKFRGFEGAVPSDCEADFIGAISHRKYLPEQQRESGSPDIALERVEKQVPPHDEEYFEWIDVLESVDSASAEYVMLEVGAGYGRWAVRAALAAKQRGFGKIFIGAVEAEPAHLEWLEEHLSRNGIRADEHGIYRVAVGAKAGNAMFYINKPGEDTEHAARDWYGQKLSGKRDMLVPGKYGSYHGHRIFTFRSGYQGIQIKVEPFSRILADFERIDLIDFDIQGEELSVIRSVLPELKQKARRLHIGTHSSEVEAGLRDLLSAEGWECRYDFACHQENDTPFGRISFVDGVQSWVRP